MPPQPKADTFTALDGLLATADIEASPWNGDVYEPHLDLLRELLAIPIKAGHGQRTGRLAKALDAWIAHELRRSGFPEESVSPRRRQPRVLPGDLSEMETHIRSLMELVEKEEAAGRKVPRALRQGIFKLPKLLPGSADANVLGRFYVKQIDVLVSQWERGPEVLVSSKTMLSSFGKNKNNRYEEAVGEAKNLRDRYPMAAMGFAYLLGNKVHQDGEAYAFIRDLLVRLRKPDGIFDATMLLVADWDAKTKTLASVEDPAETLSASRFFADLVSAVTDNTPVEMHKPVRMKRLGEQPGAGEL